MLPGSRMVDCEQRTKTKHQSPSSDDGKTLLLVLGSFLVTVFLIVPVVVYLLFVAGRIPSLDTDIPRSFFRTITSIFVSTLRATSYEDDNINNNNGDGNNRKQDQTTLLSATTATMLALLVPFVFVVVHQGAGGYYHPMLWRSDSACEKKKKRKIKLEAPETKNTKAQQQQEEEEEKEDPAAGDDDDALMAESDGGDRLSSKEVGDEKRPTTRSSPLPESVVPGPAKTANEVSDPGTDAESDIKPVINDEATLEPVGVAVTSSGSNPHYIISGDHHGSDDGDSCDDLPIQIVTQGDDVASIPVLLSRSVMRQLSRLVPAINGRKWKRRYSIARDGDAFENCLRILGSAAPTLLVVKTDRAEVFGGFADSAWGNNGNVTGGGKKFFGGHRASLFRVVSSGTDGDDQVKVYKFAMSNRYIQLCDPIQKRLAFGGGGKSGSFGLSVENNFLTGSTGRCDTFNNEPLCSQEHFRIVDLEIYEFPVW